ncbi:MAG: DinB family protein [Chloroflexi bacterium]|nr:DinB family protein [Chloroflexota bacterium]MBP8054333.1 DinB family protein [Chloroflexota bacterium]
MLDFTPVRNKQMTLNELSEGLTRNDLRQSTHEMIDKVLDLIEDCLDEDVTFVPYDPEAHDQYAVNTDETTVAWTLGHVIVHVTASSEETAFIAAELARGVPFHGRSRSELPWETVTTIAQCRQRLEESRRMRLATLELWPDKPYLDNMYQRDESSTKITPVAYFLFGLRHEDGHLAQIEEIVRQAKKAREEKMVLFAKEGMTPSHFAQS